jgi:hypothetical protein
MNSPLLNIRLWLTAGLGVLLFGTHGSVAADSAQTAPVLVELFTSEGCSSCPPAEALLRKLDTQLVQGAQVIVLEEHVDYWDDLGWKDPFSSHLWTARQTEYAQRLNVRAPYTPQMVVNGATEFVGSDARRAESALRGATAGTAVPTRISEVKFEGGKAQAHIETNASPANAEVFVALALDRAETQVRSGENGGRKLEHVAILRSLNRVGRVRKGDSFSRDVSVPADLAGKPARIIAFVQEPNQGHILGAAVEPIR